MDKRNKTKRPSGLRFVNPPGLYNPTRNGYSHLAVFPAGWRVILPAGQGGETEDQVLSEDFATQLRQAVQNTKIVLAAAGAKMSDVAKFTLYVVDHDKEKIPDHKGGIRSGMGRSETGVDAGLGASIGA